MDSDWQCVSSNKKKNNSKHIYQSNEKPIEKNPIKKNIEVIIDINIIKYNRDDIFKFKIINKENLVSQELSNIFDKINDMFKTSTQYLESKKKINYNQLNHNKWELKQDQDNTIINNIYLAFNKITEDNYQDIIKEISKQEIILYDDLEKLTEKIIHKCINEKQFLTLYLRIIKHIMVNCVWIVEDSSMIPITFRKLFINQLEMRFSNLINDIKNMKYEESEAELIIIHNKTKQGLILLIIELYKNKIIGNQLIRYIFKNLENSYDQSLIDYVDKSKNMCDQYLEYWLLIFNAIIIPWKDTEKQYLNEQIQYILSKKDNVSSKLRFYIQDQFELLKKYNYPINIESVPESITNIIIQTNSEQEDSNNWEQEEQEEQDETNDILILSSEEYETLDKWFKTVLTINKDKLLLDILQLTLSNKDKEYLVNKLLKYLVEQQYITNTDIINKIVFIKEENDLSEYRYFINHLENYKKQFA